jgi:hypothetical protein
MLRFELGSRAPRALSPFQLGLRFWCLLTLCLHLAAAGEPRPQTPSAPKHQTSPSSSFVSFRVVRPFFVIHGTNLSSVEIWISPTGTGLQPSRIGFAHLTTRAGRHETWKLAIPQDLLATEIFAIAYDKAHVELGRHSLPFKGASALFEALYGPK